MVNKNEARPLRYCSTCGIQMDIELVLQERGTTYIWYTCPGACCADRFLVTMPALEMPGAAGQAL